MKRTVDDIIWKHMLMLERIIAVQSRQCEGRLQVFGSDGNKHDTDGRAHVKETGTINVTIRCSAQLIHKPRSPKKGKRAT